MKRAIILSVLGTLSVSGPAFAACEVTQNTNFLNLATGSGHTETDCASTSGTNAALALKANSTDVDATVVILQGNIDAEKIRNDTQDGKIAAIETKNDEQDTRLTDVETKNGEQDGKIADHETRITTNTTDIASTKNRLDSFNGTGGSLETWATGTDSHLAAIDQTNFLQDNRLASLERTGEKHARGLAIAMAMPDTWLSDHEKFALAFNVGGFDNETAFGAAAIARLDRNWSLNLKAGTDSGFKEIGWTAGARYGF